MELKNQLLCKNDDLKPRKPIGNVPEADIPCVDGNAWNGLPRAWKTIMGELFLIFKNVKTIWILILIINFAKWKDCNLISRYPKPLHYFIFEYNLQICIIQDCFQTLQPYVIINDLWKDYLSDNLGVYSIQNSAIYFVSQYYV